MEERIPQPVQELHHPTVAVPEAEEEAPPTTQRQAWSAGGEAREGDDGGSDGGESESESEFEFEFPFVTRDGSPALADELFADGRIRPFYPVFGRRAGGGAVACGGAKDGEDAPPPKPRTRGPLGRLFLEESSSSSSCDSSTERSTSTSSSSDDAGGIEGAAPESYCLWTPGAGAGAASSAASVPSLRPPSKSGSTGSMARWRRISELVVGRSHSDGKEKFIFFPTPPPPPPPKDAAVATAPKPKPKPAPAGGRKKITEVDTVAAAHRMAYGGAKGNGFTGAGAGAPRRTFLPYREELVGFFANVNGITRSHPHPF